MTEFESLCMVFRATVLHVQELREQSRMLRLRSEQLIQQSMNLHEVSFELNHRSAVVLNESSRLMKQGRELLQKDIPPIT
jgi:hypothetical protein